MNILITIETLVPKIGGPYYTVNSMATALAGRGHNVTLAYLKIYDEENKLLGEGVEEVKIKGWRFECLRQNFAFNLVQKFQSIIREKQIDIVIDNGAWLYSNYAISKAAIRSKVPIVLSPRGLLEPGALRYRSLRKRIAWSLYQKKILQKVSMFHACSENEARSIKALGFEQPIAHVSNGVDFPTTPAPFDASLVNQKRVALFLSRVHPTKGVLELVHSWARVKPKNWVLRIAGEGEPSYLSKIKNLVNRYGLAEQIELIGHVEGDAKEATFRAAQLFILPTYTENFGVVIAEALSFGLPVLTTTGAPWEVLESMSIGWRIDLNEASLDRALLDASSTTTERLKEKGVAGRALIQEKFSWGSCSRCLELEIFKYASELNSKKKTDN